MQVGNAIAIAIDRDSACVLKSAHFGYMSKLLEARKEVFKFAQDSHEDPKDTVLELAGSYVDITLL